MLVISRVWMTWRRACQSWEWAWWQGRLAAPPGAWLAVPTEMRFELMGRRRSMDPGRYGLGVPRRVGYRAFLRATRDQAGFRTRLVAFGFFLAAVFIRSGVVHGVVLSLIIVGIFLGPGYLAWRRWGK